MLIPSGFVGLMAVATAMAGPPEDESPAELAAVDTTSSTTSTVVSEYFQPVVEAEGESGPFWQTTFAVIVPEGHWESVESPAADDRLCKPTGEDAYRLTNDRGVLVAAHDLPQLLAFGRSNSEIIDGNCHVEVATSGDYQDDLGFSYLLTNGILEAVFTPEQLFSGQATGPNSTLPLTPVAGAVAPAPETSTTATPATTPATPATTTPPAPTTAAPSTPAPTTAAPSTTQPPTTQDVYYANCDEARAAGAAPILRDQPGYRAGLDRDNDGIACDKES